MYNFPEIKTTRTIEERIMKVKDELKEFEEAKTQDKKDEEAVDILHSVETLLRGNFEGREDTLNYLIKKVFSKNNLREYYTKKCF